MGTYTSSGHASGGQHGRATDSSRNIEHTFNPADKRGRRGTWYGTFRPTDLNEDGEVVTSNKSRSALLNLERHGNGSEIVHAKSLGWETTSKRADRLAVTDHSLFEVTDITVPFTQNTIGKQGKIGARPDSQARRKAETLETAGERSYDIIPTTAGPTTSPSRSTFSPVIRPSPVPRPYSGATARSDKTARTDHNHNYIGSDKTARTDPSAKSENTSALRAKPSTAGKTSTRPKTSAARRAATPTEEKFDYGLLSSSMHFLKDKYKDGPVPSSHARLTHWIGD